MAENNKSDDTQSFEQDLQTLATLKIIQWCNTPQIGKAYFETALAMLQDIREYTSKNDLHDGLVSKVQEYNDWVWALQDSRDEISKGIVNNTFDSKTNFIANKDLPSPSSENGQEMLKDAKYEMLDEDELNELIGRKRTEITKQHEKALNNRYGETELSPRSLSYDSTGSSGVNSVENNSRKPMLRKWQQNIRSRINKLRSALTTKESGNKQRHDSKSKNRLN